MPLSEQASKDFEDLQAQFQEKMAEELADDIAENPRLIDALDNIFDEQIGAVAKEDLDSTAPPDSGLSDLIGLTPTAPTGFGATRVPAGVEGYDDTIASERIIAVADLYYIYQHEKIGIFRIVQKLKELFEAGMLRLSSGAGALGLYRFDRRQVLRYTHRDRWAAYRRIFGYGSAPLQTGARPNMQFHPLFTLFIDEVTLFWRDKRISDVMRERAYDPSFGSIATVRRAGLDLRNNLKWESYGHINVMRVEVMQLLDECFRILEAPDIRNEFGAENAWDVVEEVLMRYFKEELVTSPRQRMGVTGRNILRWLGQPFILKTTRAQFEALLSRIAGDAEEWITSAETLGVHQRRPPDRTLPWESRRTATQPRPVAAARPAGTRSTARRPRPSPNGRQTEFEFESEYESEY